MEARLQFMTGSNPALNPDALEASQFFQALAVARRLVQRLFRWHEGTRSVNIGHRVFVVEDDAIAPISQKTFNALYFRDEAALPRLANRTVQIAVVIYTLERRKPAKIIRIDCQRIRIRADGSIDKKNQFEGLHLAAGRLGKLDQEPQSSGNVVDAKARFDQRNWEQRHPKLPGKAEKRILDALFR